LLYRLYSDLPQGLGFAWGLLCKGAFQSLS
jgi:hypothetical protein